MRAWLRFRVQPSGRAGKDFIRFSFASSMATLQEAVERIQKVSARGREQRLFAELPVQSTQV